MVGAIKTYPTGIFVTPLDLKSTMIHLEDFAHSLSHLPRFLGHTPVPHSVAEHSVRVSLLVEDWGGTLDEQRWGLIHDFPEAFLGDLPSPLKKLDEFAFYREAEDRAMAVIAQRFGLPPVMPDIVHRADRERAIVDTTETRYSYLSWGPYEAKTELLKRAEHLGLE